MGGYGSTRWAWHSKADTVESCRSLDIKRFVEEDVIVANQYSSGLWTWRNSTDGEVKASIRYAVYANETDGVIKLTYTMTQTKHDLEYNIRLTTTRPHFGGVRWFFLCPLVNRNRPCQRRVCKLYLPPGGRYFGCRHCHQLTYKSSQESDACIRALRKLGVEHVLAGLQDGSIDFIKGLQALPDEIWRR